MKSAIYLDEGTTQLALTPENDWEKNILRMMKDALPGAMWGEFYSCNGGWIRQSPQTRGPFYTDSNPNENSLIFRVDKPANIAPA